MWKSALGYFAAGTTGAGANNELIGSTLELGNMNLRVKRIVAEGGFAVVFEAIDLASNRSCAVKRLIGHDAEKRAEIEQEISFMKILSGHPNIIKFITAASSKNEHNGSTEYLVVMEYCPKGCLTDLVKAKDGKFTLEEVICFFYQITRSVQHMHCQEQPICHRDLKLENILLDNRSRLKLCDFGSATTVMHYPDYSWTALKRSQVEDEIVTHTTPMYRTPEMLDLYQNFPINVQQDVWALGCTLYLLCYGAHPFEDSAKLRILNANYTLEGKNPQFEVLNDLIHGCLKVDPRERPSIHDIVQRIEEIADALGINLASLLKSSAKNSPIHSMPSPSPTKLNSVAPPARPPPPKQIGRVPDSATPQDGAMLSNIKSGASSIFHNMKEASNKMVETVASYTKGELDISYITSRIVVMSYPGEGIQAAVKNNIEEVRAFLETKHSNHYAVYNLTLSPYRPEKFCNRVSDCGWPNRKSPSLANLLTICKNMQQWLKIDVSNVCVVHCSDGKAQSALVVSAFFAFCSMYQTIGPSLHLFTVRRCAPNIIPSHQRYIEYVADICNNSSTVPPTKPHSRYVKFHSLILQPVPLINSQRTGVKPFVEVFVNENRVFTTSQEYERIPGFDTRDPCAAIPLDIKLVGDITLIVYHARSILGGKVQAKNISLKMFQFQFNTGFLPKNSTRIKFARHDLDYLETPDKYPDMFIASLQYDVCAEQAPTKHPWDDVSLNKDATPYLVVKDDHELNGLYREVGAPEPRSTHAHEDGFDFKSTPDAGNPPILTTTVSPSDGKGNSEFNTSSQFEDPDLLENTLTANGNHIAQPVPDLLDLRLDDTVVPNGNSRSNSPFNEGFNAADPFSDPFQPSVPTKSTTNDPFDLFSSNPFETLPTTEQPNLSSQPHSGIDFFDERTPPDPFGAATPFAASSGQQILNQSQFQSQPEFTAAPPMPSSSDLLGDWSDPTSSQQPSSMPPSSSSDPFGGSFENSGVGSWGAAEGHASFQSAFQPGSKSSNSSTKKPDVFQTLDPFAAFGSVGATQPNASTRSDQRSRSPHLTVNNQGIGAGARRSVSPSPTLKAADFKSVPSDSGAASSKPNYNVNVPLSSQPKPTSTGGPAKMDRNCGFADLLGGFGGCSTNGDISSQKVSMKDMKKAQLLDSGAVDPDEMKIREWTEGKEGNIRALLCSLHKVVWEDARWQECGMHQLVAPTDVKKMWRKALLAVHPDKQVGTKNEKISKLIMVELNDSWDQYQNSGAQSLYGNS